MTHMASLLRQKKVPQFVMALSLVVFMGTGMSQAQTTNITSSGLGTDVQPPVTGTTSIVGGTTAGSNLFHSFGNFSIGAGEMARFETNSGAASAAVSNILSRVTGGSSSNIFGTINSQTFFPNANLFLLNPAGFMFGPNATINVGGSANFATADYLLLGGGVRFNAVPGSADALLNTAQVGAFGFLGGNPVGTITIQGGTVKNTSTLTLVGRDNVDGAPGIQVTGTLLNPGGDIRLVSVGTPTNPNVSSEVTAQTLAPISSHGFTSLGSIEVKNKGIVSTSSAPGTSSGDIFIRTGNLAVNDGKLLTDSTGDFSSPVSFITGSIEVHADAVALNRARISTMTSSNFSNSGNIDFSDISSLTATESNFDASSQSAGAGQINIGSANTSVIDLDHTIMHVSHDIIDSSPSSFGSIELTGSSIALHESDLIGNAFGSSRGGTIRLNGHNINISGSSLRAEDQTGGGGGGAIIIGGLRSTGSAPTLANQVALTNGAFLNTGTTTSGTGGAGVTIRSANVLVDGASVSTEGVIKSGPILVEAGTLTLQNGATMSTRVVDEPNNPGPGTGGLITIHAETITMSGKSVILSSTNHVGVGGTIDINSQSIRMSEGAKIDASTSGLGSAGNISINSELIAGDKSTVISTSSTGKDLAFINTSPTESGRAGDLSLKSPTSLTIRGMTIQTSSKETSGGNIKLTAPNLIRIADSTLTSSVQGQAGSNGGNINVDPQLVVIQNSQIFANANAGAGGNIAIVASGAVLVDPNSLLNASAGPAGVSGSVNINAPLQFLSGVLVPLKLAYSQAGLSGDRCAADPTGQFSSFVQAGRDSVPQVPGALSPSPLSFLETLTSGSLDSQGPDLAAARLGLDFDSRDDSTLFRFPSACRS